MIHWRPQAFYCLFAFVVLAVIVILLFMDANNPLAYFRSYRRAKGGKWRKSISRIPGVPFMWALLYTLPDDGHSLGYIECDDL